MHRPKRVTGCQRDAARILAVWPRLRQRRGATAEQAGGGTKDRCHASLLEVPDYRDQMSLKLFVVWLSEATDAHAINPDGRGPSLAGPLTVSKRSNADSDLQALQKQCPRMSSPNPTCLRLTKPLQTTIHRRLVAINAGPYIPNPHARPYVTKADKVERVGGES